MRFAAIVAFPRFFRVYPSLPYPKEFFFYMRDARYAAPLIRRMTGVCAGRTAFLREKRRILRFRQTPFSAYGIFLQNPANFPFRFFSYGKRGIRIKKTPAAHATLRPHDSRPIARPSASSVRRLGKPPQSHVARNAFFAVRTRYFAPRHKQARPRLKRIRPQ